MSSDDVLADLYRAEAGRILGALVAQVPDLDLAEDALQDAMAEAVVAWRRDGVPRNGGAWLLTVSRRRVIDRLRRANRQQCALDVAAAIAQMESWPPNPDDNDEVPDERLRLIFTCCHPALPEDVRIPLTLRTLCGLTTEEIARAFLVSTSTMRQQITRAKDKIRTKRIPFVVPEGRELSIRLESVLEVVYLIFNEGYAPTNVGSVTRNDLCQEAIRLGRLLYRLVPAPEVGGLLALMLFNDARRPARMNADRSYVSLAEQDRSLWNRDQIGEAKQILYDCLAHRQPGQYQIQAAISAVHSEAESMKKTDWIQIAGLYVALSQAAPSAVVTLNHAVAVSYAESPDAGLGLLETVAEELQSYQPFHAAHADILWRLERNEEACAAYRRCLLLTRNAPERRFLQRKLSAAQQSAEG